MTIDINSDAINRHLDDTVRSWLGIKQSQDISIPQMPDDLKALFLRKEEYVETDRDIWGNWEFPFSKNYKDGNLWIPQINNWVEAQKNNLQQDGISLEERWPGNHKFSVFLSHDVDRVSMTSTFTQQLRELKKWFVLHGAASPASRVYNILKSCARPALKRSSRFPTTENTMDPIIKYLNEAKVKSTFFFMTYPLVKYSPYDAVYSPDDKCHFQGKDMKVSDMMKILNDEGHDVGLHGSYYSAVTPGMLKHEKSIIEEAAGFEISSSRQHWLHYEIENTPNYQENDGFKSDSTIGFNRNIGFRSGVALPYFHIDLNSSKKLDILQVPLHLMEGPLFAESGLNYSLETAKETMKTMIDDVAKTEGCISILFHPHSFIHERIHELFKWTLDYCNEKNAWITSLKEINDWWRERDKRLN